MALQIEIRSTTERRGMEDPDIWTSGNRDIGTARLFFLQALLILPVAVPARNAAGFVLLSFDYANEKGVLSRSSAHVIEKQGKIGSGYRSVGAFSSATELFRQAIVSNRAGRV